MGLFKYFNQWMTGGSNSTIDDTPEFKCLRCGVSFERQHHSCPDCDARFVVEIGED